MIKLELIRPISTSDLAQQLAQNENVSDESAKAYYEKVIELVKYFEKNTDPEHEVAICLANFGQLIQFIIRNIDWENPKLIIFSGEQKDGAPITVIQNVSQINFMLSSATKNQKQPKIPIGFRRLHQNEENQ